MPHHDDFTRPGPAAKRFIGNAALVLSVLVVSTGAQFACGAPEHCRSCLAALADAGRPGVPGIAGASATGGRGPLGSGGMVGSGGVVGTAGTGSGGANAGGANTGGASTGGAGTGGANTGGASTGGAGTGGASTGGANTGGASTGGASTGGAGTGGRGTGGAGTGGAAAALILGIDFVGGESPGTPTTSMTATESAGVKPASRWNSAPGNTGTKSSLVLADGTATSTSATWNSPSDATASGTWLLGYTDTPGNVRMMNGYLDPAFPATVSVSGLPASITGGGYDVYVYTYGDVPSGQTRTYGYAIGSASFVVRQTGPYANPFAGFSLAPNQGSGNYVVFRRVTGSSFTLTATPMTGNRAPINGLQIVWPTGS